MQCGTTANRRHCAILTRPAADDKRMGSQCVHQSWPRAIGGFLVGSSERRKEINRRRQRRKKLSKLSKRAENANVSEKTVIAGKIRQLTPGAEAIIQRLELDKR